MNAVKIEQRSAHVDALEMHIRTQAQSILTVAGSPAELPSYTLALEVLEAARMAEADVLSPPAPTSEGKYPRLRSVK